MCLTKTKKSIFKMLSETLFFSSKVKYRLKYFGNVLQYNYVSGSQIDLQREGFPRTRKVYRTMQ